MLLIGTEKCINKLNFYMFIFIYIYFLNPETDLSKPPPPFEKMKYLNR